ncbi:MAG: sulfotransferase [Brevundimonas sp.]|nr:sulfotransferase [Brevundimonas sp.]MDZ4113565.1 sulfotransferase [Brevundimonas sp.]
MNTVQGSGESEPVATPRHLVHVGFAKAGSTFLQRWFEGHPDIRYFEGGLAGYQDVHDVVRHAASGAQASQWHVTSAEGLLAPQLKEGGGRWEVLVRYEERIAQRQRRACHILGSLFPEATVLIVTRGFRSMLLSSYSQYVRTGGTATFDSPLDKDMPREPFGDDMPWNYDSIIGLYRSVFGTDRVIILPYELLRDDQSRFLRILEARLGISLFDSPVGRPNPSLSEAEMFWYPRIGRFLKAMPLPRRPREWIFRQYARRIFHSRLAWLAEGLTRWFGPPPDVASRLDLSKLERCRGKAECLSAIPEYGAYAADYMNEVA